MLAYLSRHGSDPRTAARLADARLRRVTAVLVAVTCGLLAWAAAVPAASATPRPLPPLGGQDGPFPVPATIVRMVTIAGMAGLADHTDRRRRRPDRGRRRHAHLPGTALPPDAERLRSSYGVGVRQAGAVRQRSYPVLMRRRTWQACERTVSASAGCSRSEAADALRYVVWLWPALAYRPVWSPLPIGSYLVRGIQNEVICAAPGRLDRPVARGCGGAGRHRAGAFRLASAGACSSLL
jgi:hypothetical protein